MFLSLGIDLRGNPRWDYRSVKTFPKPPEFDRVKRLRYDPAKDVTYIGGTKGEHVNQHWKPMGRAVCRFDGRSKGVVRPTWRIVAPYAKGSKEHESCEPIGFDVAGDYEFLPYTGASKSIGFKTGRIEVFRADKGRRVRFIEPSDDVGEIRLAKHPRLPPSPSTGRRRISKSSSRRISRQRSWCIAGGPEPAESPWPHRTLWVP